MSNIIQSISISKHPSIAYGSDDDADLSDVDQLDIDLTGIDEEKKEIMSMSATENKINPNNKKERPQAQKYSNSSHKLRNKSSSNKFAYGNLTLAPINSAASMGSESLKLSVSSKSTSKSYNRKFEDEESGIEIEAGLDLREAMIREKENAQKESIIIIEA